MPYRLAQAFERTLGSPEYLAALVAESQCRIGWLRRSNVVPHPDNYEYPVSQCRIGWLMRSNAKHV